MALNNVDVVENADPPLANQTVAHSNLRRVDYPLPRNAKKEATPTPEGGMVHAHMRRKPCNTNIESSTPNQNILNNQTQLRLKHQITHTKQTE